MARERWIHGLTRDGGPEIHFVEHGSGEPLVLLHGFPDFWYMWRHQIPALASSGFRVIALDLRGYNRSAAPIGVRNYTVDKLSNDVIRVLDTLGILTAHVAGHDWGGVIAWDLAMRHPERLRKLVVMNAPHPATYTRALITSAQALKSWYVAAFQVPLLPELLLKRRNMAALQRVWRGAGGGSQSVTESDLSKYVKTFSREYRLTAALNYYRAFLFSAHRPEKVTPVSAETLILWGARDKYLVPQLADAALRHVPNLRVQRFDALGHWPQLEDPAAVNSAIVKFLAAG